MSQRLLNAAQATTSAPALSFATGTITAVAGANLVDGETFTITNRRGVKVTFEFDSNTAVTAGNVAVTFAGGDSSTTVATAIAAAISAQTNLGLASVGVVATVTNTARLSGPDWNAAVVETVANGTFAVTDITGGTFAGLPLQGTALNGDGYWEKTWDVGVLVAKGAGTGALTFQGIVFLYDALSDAWYPAGISATIADRGKLNDGNTITGTTTLVHTQPIYALSAYTRIALQITTLTGTGMTVSAYLIPRYQS